jgi:hypothetical protein
MELETGYGSKWYRPFGEWKNFVQTQLGMGRVAGGTFLPIDSELVPSRFCAEAGGGDEDEEEEEMRRRRRKRRRKGGEEEEQ